MFTKTISFLLVAGTMLPTAAAALERQARPEVDRTRIERVERSVVDRTREERPTVDRTRTPRAPRAPRAI